MSDAPKPEDADSWRYYATCVHAIAIAACPNQWYSHNRGERRERAEALMYRLFVMVVTGVACVGAGATGSLIAFSSIFGPLSAANFGEAVFLGACCGVAGAIIGVGCLLLIEHRPYLLSASVLVVVVTWMATFVAIGWFVICSLG